ncbi:MAG: ABC transporter substrate-binding protein [Alphaproteobacteria bacterium]
MKVIDIVARGSVAGRREIIALLAVLLFSFSAASVAASAEDSEAGEFVRILGERAVDVLRDKENTTFAEREFAFRNILVEGFHIKTISRFVLGRHWRSATEAQRQAYDDVFVDFIVRVYASRFDSYDGEEFEILQAVDSDIDGDTIVRTHIIRPSGGAPIAVDYRVRVIDGGYRVVDVNVEGISMLHTHRVEFASVINRKGMDGFLEELRKQVEERDKSPVN